MAKSFCDFRFSNITSLSNGVIKAKTFQYLVKDYLNRPAAVQGFPPLLKLETYSNQESVYCCIWRSNGADAVGISI